MFGALDNSITGSHTEREWTELVLAWGSRCFYCGRPVQIKPELSDDELTKDHLIPLFRGGSDDIGNIVPACLPCNQLKGTMTVDEFRQARPVFFTAEQNERRESTGRDALGGDPHPALVQAVHYLAPKMNMDPAADPEFWKQRRALLRQQMIVIGRRNLESAGQLTLPLFGDGSQKKSAEAEAAVLTVRKGLTL